MGLLLIGCGGEQRSEAGDAGRVGAGDGSATDEDARAGSGDASTTTSGDATVPLQDGAAAQAEAGQYPLIGLDEPCEGGPTGRQLLAYVESNYEGAYTPPPSHPDASASALTITTSYDGGTIACTPSPPYNCCAGCPCRAQTPPAVSVSLEVGFKTADGTFDESFVGTATLEPDISEVTWTATLAPGSVRGTYPFSAGSIGLAFSGTFEHANAAGSLAEEFPPAPGSSTLSGGTWMASTLDAGGD
jgi:hypothetical protein